MRNKRIPSKQAFRANISKEEVLKFPTETFHGSIIIVDKKEDVPKAIAHLKKHTFVGLDTETRPSFSAGITRNVSLIQISTESDCFLFRVNKTGLTQELIDFLEDDAIYKIGLSLKDDIRAISKIQKFHPKGFVELQKICPAYGIKELGLQRIYGILFKKYLSKGQRLSNWEADILSPAQQNYAALDAWATLAIYFKLLSKSNPNPINFGIIE